MFLYTHGAITGEFDQPVFVTQAGDSKPIKQQERSHSPKRMRPLLYVSRFEDPLCRDSDPRGRWLAVTRIIRSEDPDPESECPADLATSRTLGRILEQRVT